MTWISISHIYGCMSNTVRRTRAFGQKSKYKGAHDMQIYKGNHKKELCLTCSILCSAIFQARVYRTLPIFPWVSIHVSMFQALSARYATESSSSQFFPHHKKSSFPQCKCVVKLFIITSYIVASACQGMNCVTRTRIVFAPARSRSDRPHLLDQQRTGAIRTPSKQRKCG
jgi:hypothetical protein